jgi:hypothetical protein
MSHEESNESRRRFLKIAAGTAAAAVVVGTLPRLARAADLPHVSESDPTAKALGYVEDANATGSAKVVTPARTAAYRWSDRPGPRQLLPASPSPPRLVRRTGRPADRRPSTVVKKKGRL